MIKTVTEVARRLSQEHGTVEDDDFSLEPGGAGEGSSVCAGEGERRVDKKDVVTGVVLVRGRYAGSDHSENEVRR